MGLGQGLGHVLRFVERVGEPSTGQRIVWTWTPGRACRKHQYRNATLGSTTSRAYRQPQIVPLTYIIILRCDALSPSMTSISPPNSGRVPGIQLPSVDSGIWSE